MQDIAAVLDTLANQIAKDLEGPKVSLDQRLEAFRILSAHQIAFAKMKPRGDGGDDTPNFDTMRSRIQSVS